MKPTIIPLLQPLVRAEVMSQVRELSAGAEGKPFFLKVIGVANAADVRFVGGDAAQVGIKSGDRTTEFGMRRAGGRWQIVSVNDETLVARMAAKAAVPPSGSINAIGGGLLDLLPGAGRKD